MTKSEKIILLWLAFFLIAGLSVRACRESGHMARFKVVRTELPARSEESFQRLDKRLLKQKQVDLNSAGAEELESLPNIGPVIAGAIINYRRQFGPFKTPEEVIQVRGLGPKRFEKIRELLLVNGKTVSLPAEKQGHSGKQVKTGDK